MMLRLREATFQKTRVLSIMYTEMQYFSNITFFLSFLLKTGTEFGFQSLFQMSPLPTFYDKLFGTTTPWGKQ